MRHTNGRHICPSDRIALLFSYSVGPSATNLFSSLLNGATLLPFNLKELGVGHLAQWLMEEEITMFHAVPTVFRHFVDSLKGDHTFPKLRLIRLGGETMVQKDLQRFKEHFNDNCILHVGMGSGERFCLECFFDRETECHTDLLPAGYAAEDTKILLLDEKRQTVGFERIGEIAVKSRYLSPGYWQKPEHTRATFLPDPDGGKERIYLTGDLGYMLSDGCVFHLGRKDMQIKIRGYRVEPGEIEAVLLSISGVEEAVVVGKEDRQGDKRLVAYIVLRGEPPPTIQALRKSLRQRLPGYMVPSAFVHLESLPLLPSGKVDRKGLPDPDPSQREADNCLIAPRTTLEKVVAEIWREVLGVDELSVEDDFFDLGGHSLQATQVISRIGEAYQVDLLPQLLFVLPTVAALAQQLEAAIKKRSDPHGPLSGRVPRGLEPELSFGQERLWFLDQLEPGKSWYNTAWAFRLRGELDEKALRQALDLVVERHEILRTNYRSLEGRPIQIVREASPVPWREADLRDMAEDKRRARLHHLLEDEATRAFDLSRDLMLRAFLAREEERQWILLLVSHHIASDAWSRGILCRELSQCYAALRESKIPVLPELPIQYADYASWQRQWLTGHVLEAQLAYWKRQLAGELPVLELPADRPRPATLTYSGGQVRFSLSSELSLQLRTLSRQEGVTLFMILIAAFKVLLYRYTGQTDMVVGTPIAGRTRCELEGLIGFFVNTLVLRTDLEGEPSFRELLQRVRETALAAYEHQDSSFEKLVQELQPERDMSRHPLFQVMFILENTPRREFELSGLKTEQLEVQTRTAKFDLTLALADHGENLTGFLEYNADLFDRETTERIIGHYQCLLEEAVENPDKRISILPLLTESERQQILIEWNDTWADYPRQQCIHELFELQVTRSPEAVALVHQKNRLNYEELNGRANQLAYYLRGRGVGPETLVGICMERSVDMVVGLLGILKAGGVYVPLDPAYPQQRLAWMLEDAQIQVVLTQQRVLDAIPIGHADVICLDKEWDKITLKSRDNPVSVIGAGQLAYVIYTSGSTGQPKGVQIPHNAVVNFLHAMRRRLNVSDADTVLAVTTLSFDIAGLELFLPLSSGAQVVVASREETTDGQQLMKKLRESEATLMQATPATWRMLVDSGWTGDKRLRILCGGEALPQDLASQLLVKGGSLWNLYGPTETTIWSSVHQVTKLNEPILIGRPIANTQIYILDRYRQLVPVGVRGELHIGGDGVARGYVNRPELTEQKFIPNTFSDELGERLYKTGDIARYLTDGNIEFLGRVDHQVKIRGFRIELGEIEAVLSQQPAVREAVVVAREDVSGEKRLVGYVVPSQEPAPTTSELRVFLQQKLPDYMVPSIFVTLKVLPLTPNGKVDRRALPVPDQSRTKLESSFIAPRTQVEELVAGVWAQVLKLEQVGIQDNFFELGGHSLLAMQVISRIRNAFEVDLPVRDLFEKPTVAGLAERVETIRWSTRGVPPVGPQSDRAEIEL